MPMSSRPLTLSRTRTRPGARSWNFALAETYNIAAIKKGPVSLSEVECLHSQGVVHRDIKPEYLFFDTQRHLKVCLISHFLTNDQEMSHLGFLHPDIFFILISVYDPPHAARLVDIWAWGIVYYCLHFREMPWRVAQTSYTLYAAYTQACTSHLLKDAHSHIIKGTLRL